MISLVYYFSIGKVNYMVLSPCVFRDIRPLLALFHIPYVFGLSRLQGSSCFAYVYIGETGRSLIPSIRKIPDTVSNCNLDTVSGRPRSFVLLLVVSVLQMGIGVRGFSLAYYKL
jgi:hypothetical protein